MIRRINEARPDVLWVGLGLPKQEQWIYEHRSRLNVPVVLGVGAAFKFLAGTVRRAPGWLGDLGLEWLWRLAHEPRRLWRRVMIEGPQFVGHAEGDVKIAVVDRTQLDADRAPFQLARGDGITGHAADR